MCDPATAIGLALGAFSALGSLTQSTPEPPNAETPAIAAPTGRTPGATVRLGNSDDDITNENPNSTQPSIFAEKRTSGNSLGNLGKSGLAL